LSTRNVSTAVIAPTAAAAKISGVDRSNLLGVHVLAVDLKPKEHSNTKNECVTNTVA
jgi:hypothetical protein